MANNSRLTYIEPKDKFKKINMDVILKYDPIIVGIYCKLVTMSSGKSLSIAFLSKKLQVSMERMRKTIVFLEGEGYIKRDPLRDENGHMSGWNYFLFAEPISKEERTRAGLKKNKDENPRVEGSPCYGVSDNTEKGKDNNIDNISSKHSLSDNNIDLDKKSTNVDEKVCVSESLFPEQQAEEKTYNDYMREHYPFIMKMDQPLTRKQARQLKEDFGEDVVLEVFEAMNNYKPLLKNNRSAYKTAINWCNRRTTRTGV